MAKNWGNIKSKIKDHSSSELLKVIADLYNLNNQNKNFLEARFLSSAIDSLEPYKKIIERYPFPDITRGRPLQIKPISQTNCIFIFQKTGFSDFFLIFSKTVSYSGYFCGIFCYFWVILWILDATILLKTVFLVK